jgi:serine/threonine protein kinase
VERLTAARPPPAAQFDDYEILGEIARGGMGVVYRARQKNLNRTVALKMIGGAVQSDDLRRFRLEVEAAVLLDHPNIVPVYEVGEQDGRPFYAMKLMEGGSLKDRLADFRSSQTDAVQLVVTLARAVHHAHQHGILHRDLKPANILFDAHDRPHVADFGLASHSRRRHLTATGVLVGTPSHMAPEQIAERTRLTTAVDVYGLGLLLYELLTGRLPFVSESPFATLRLILDAEPPRPRASARGRARSGSDLSALAWRRSRPAATARPRLAAISRAGCTASRFSPLQLGLVSRPSSGLSARPAIALLLAATVFLTVLGVAGVTWQWRVAEGRRLRPRRPCVRRRQNLYLHRITLAEREWTAGRRSRAALLDACARSCGWEWHYLQRLPRGVLRWPVIVAPSTPSPSAPMANASPPAAGIAPFASGTPRRVRLHRLDGHRTILRRVAFSPTAARGLGRRRHRRARLERRDGPTCSDCRGEIRRLRPRVQPRRYALGYSTTADDPVVALDTRTWEVVLSVPLPSLGPNYLAFDPSGKRLVCGHANHLSIREATGAARALGSVRLEGTLRGVAFAPDGSRFATAGPEDTATEWSVDPPKRLHTFSGHGGTVTAVHYVPGTPSLLATAAADGLVRLWDTRTGRREAILRGHAGYLWGLDVSRDGGRALLPVRTAR